MEASALFGPVLDKVRSLAVGEEAKANDPEILAATVYRALTDANPKAAYSVRADFARTALEYIPTRLGDKLLEKVLTSPIKD